MMCLQRSTCASEPPDYRQYNPGQAGDIDPDVDSVNRLDARSGGGLPLWLWSSRRRLPWGTTEIGAGLAARGFVWSLVPAKRVWRLIFMVRAVIIAAVLV